MAGSRLKSGALATNTVALVFVWSCVSSVLRSAVYCESGAQFLKSLPTSQIVTRVGCAWMAAGSSSRGLLGAYASTLGLTLTNPATILSFVAIFAGLGFVSTASSAHGAAPALVLGVFSGSALRWLLLSTGIGLLRGWFTPGRLAWVNRALGVLLLGF